MSFFKTKLNLLNIAVVTTILSFAPGLASANPPVEGDVEMTAPEPVSGGFETADLNADGVLNMSEFTLYAGNQAVGGDSDFTTIVSSGDYEAAFTLLDANADGHLSVDEVTDQDADIEGHNMTPEGEIDMKAE